MLRPYRITLENNEKSGRSRIERTLSLGQVAEGMGLISNLLHSKPLKFAISETATVAASGTYRCTDLKGPVARLVFALSAPVVGVLEIEPAPRRPCIAVVAVVGEPAGVLQHPRQRRAYPRTSILKHSSRSLLPRVRPTRRKSMPRPFSKRCAGMITSTELGPPFRSEAHRRRSDIER